MNNNIIYYDNNLEKKRYIFLIIFTIFLFIILFGYLFFYIYYNNIAIDILNPVIKENNDTSIGELINNLNYFLNTGYNKSEDPRINQTRDRNYNNPINGSKLSKNECNKQNMIYDGNYCKCITPFWGEFCEKQSSSDDYYQLGKYYGSSESLIEKNGNIFNLKNIAWCSNFSLNNNCTPEGNIEVICKQSPLCVGYYLNQGVVSFFYIPDGEQDVYSLNIDFINDSKDNYGNYIYNGNVFIKNEYKKTFVNELVYILYDNIILDKYWIFNPSFYSKIINPNDYVYSNVSNNQPLVLIINQLKYLILNGKYREYYMVTFTDITKKMINPNEWEIFCKNINDGFYKIEKRKTFSSNLNNIYIYFVKITDLITNCNISIF